MAHFAADKKEIQRLQEQNKALIEEVNALRSLARTVALYMDRPVEPDPAYKAMLTIDIIDALKARGFLA